MPTKDIFYSPQLFPKHLDVDKKWYVEYFEPTHNGYGKKVVKIYGQLNSLPTLKEKIKHSKELFREVYRYKRESEVKKQTHFLLEWLDNNQHSLRLKSYSTYKSKIITFIDYLNKHTGGKITELCGLEFLQYLSYEKKSPRTVNNYRATLRSIFVSLIYCRKYTASNPFDLTKKISCTSTGKLYFTTDQQNKLKVILKNDKQMWLAVQLQYYCFIRNGNEMTGIKVSDFDFTPGNEKILMRSEISKNKKNQYVLLPKHIIEEFLFLRELPGNYFVFSNTGVPGTEKVNRDYFNRKHRHILKEANIVGKRYTFYSWKHTGIYMFIKSGGNIK
jgi:site-specific recombinase XerD